MTSQHHIGRNRSPSRGPRRVSARVNHFIDVETNHSARQQTTTPLSRPTHRGQRSANADQRRKQLWREKRRDARKSCRKQGRPSWEDPRPVNLQKKSIHFCSMNVRTASAVGDVDRICHLLEQRTIQIAALQETRWKKSGESKQGNFYTYSTAAVDGLGGIAILSRWRASNYHIYNERIIRITLPTSPIITEVICVYGYTNSYPLSTREMFFVQLASLLASINDDRMVVLLGDFNAQLLRRHSNVDDNATLFRDLNYSSSLIPVCTKFRAARFTWRHPAGSKHKLDYIVCKRRHQTWISNVRSDWSFPFSSDHCCLRGELHMSLKSNFFKQKKPPRQNNVSSPQYQQCFNSELNKRLELFSSVEHVNDQHNHLITAINEANNAITTQQNVSSKHEIWFSQKTLKLLERREKEGKTVENELRDSIKFDKNKYFEDKAQEIDVAFSQNRLSTAFKTIRSLTGCQSDLHPDGNLTDGSGRVLHDSKERAEALADVFGAVLCNSECPSTLTPEQLDVAAKIPQKQQMELIEDEFTLDELKTAVNRLKNGKSGAVDGIIAEHFKTENSDLDECVLKLMNQVWSGEISPSQWNTSLCFPLWKNKGKKSDICRYRAVMVSSIFLKLFSTMLLLRCNVEVFRRLRQNQHGFIPNKSTLEASWVVMELQQLSKRLGIDLYLYSLDWSCAFDSVSRKMMFLSLSRFGFSDKYLRIFESLYDGISYQVVCEDSMSDSRVTTVGTRQGDVLSPLFFLIIIDTLMSISVDPDSGVTIGEESHGSRRSARLNAGNASETQMKLADIEFADDTLFIDKDIEKLRIQANVVRQHGSAFGLKSNAEKSELICLSGQIDNSAANANFGVNFSSSILYLGVTFDNTCRFSGHSERRLKLGQEAFSRMKGLWKCTNLTLSTKVKLWQATVVNIMWYGVELVPALKNLLARYSSVYHKQLRIIIGEFYCPGQRLMTNAEVRRKANVQHPCSKIIQRQWRWFGHLHRSASIAKTAASTPEIGKKKTAGRPIDTWLSCLKKASNCYLPDRNLKNICVNRKKWIKFVNSSWCVYDIP
jgi:hypothetical protein